MSEALIVQCGHCGARYRIDERKKGRRGRCRRCHHVFWLTPKVSLDDTVLDWLQEDDEAVASEKGESPNAA